MILIPAKMEEAAMRLTARVSAQEDVLETNVRDAQVTMYSLKT